MTREQARAWRFLMQESGHVISDKRAAQWSVGMEAVVTGPALDLHELGSMPGVYLNWPEQGPQTRAAR